MSDSTQAQCIELLRRQIRRAQHLLGSTPIDEHARESWENTTREFLVKSFGKDSENVEQFLEKSRLYCLSSGTDLDEHYLVSTKAQIAHLKSCIEVLLADVDVGTSKKRKVAPAKMNFSNLDGGPLSRRYQVFVSSTYEDLKEERKHVIQALLETKCIPAGMELFPAASEEQWNLIKRVIDDCDYYMVIVAGRYGSISSEGKSYTEMEFDYAVSTGKSVIGFYHSNLKSLSWDKTEESDVNRQKLGAFTSKVKARMCKGWSTAEGLGSAIKSAILHAIETDPKPGWVRAQKMVPSEPTTNPRISSSPALKKVTFFGEEPLKIPVEIRYYEETVDNSTGKVGFSNWKSKQIILNSLYKDIFLILGPRLVKMRLRRTIKMYLQQRLLDLAKPVAFAMSERVKRAECSVEDEMLDRILDVLVAEKLLRIVLPRRAGVQYWETTSKGQQKLAELRVAEKEGN